MNKRISKKAITNKKKSQQGGKFLGEGSFGCVVSPALSCRLSRITRKSKSSNKQKKTANQNNSNSNSNSKTVSKIILSPDDDVREEINIAMKLKKIDPTQKYFITLNDHCKLKQVPKERSNIARVRYTDNSATYYKQLEKKTLDKKYCPVDLSMQPVNLIMPYGGYDLVELANVINKYGLDSISTKNNISDKALHKLMTSKMLFANLQFAIRNLVMGLMKMHQHRIVNRDIKEENIMVNYDMQSKTFAIRYIDYGLSEELTPEYCSRYSNISKNGTYQLLAPEIFIIYYINRYNNSSDEYIMGKINNDIQTYVKKMLKDLKLDTSELNNVVRELFTNIRKQYSNRTILPKYFGTTDDPLNGYLQKNDVYSLGLTLYEFLTVYTDVIDINTDIRLKDLFKCMLELNPDKRYNALQCLNHPYLKV